eukprot:26921-Pyramimonas_sp.AAC.1
MVARPPRAARVPRFVVWLPLSAECTSALEDLVVCAGSRVWGAVPIGGLGLACPLAHVSST